jgi:signal peptidase I
LLASRVDLCSKNPGAASVWRKMEKTSKAWLRPLLSFLLPGWGQAAAGRPLRGALIFVGYLVLIAALGAATLSLGPKTWWALATVGDLSVRVASAVDARRLADEEAPGCLMTIGALVAMTFATAAVNTVLEATLTEIYSVPSSTMEPAIGRSDYIVVDKRAFEPKASDVVLFELSENRQQDFVKRIVGMPGDVVEVKNGWLQINGEAVRHCPLDDAHQVETLGGHRHVIRHDGQPEPDQGPWTVPPGEYFVMGDNRAQSFDSRDWNGGQGGTVPRDQIKGRAHHVFWPIDRMGVNFDSSSVACR